jgi:RimJ/RimL family protein N-acetyltransferase
MTDIRIRPYTLADARDVFAAARESFTELNPWMPWCHPDYCLEESIAWLEVQVAAFQQGTAYEFAMISPDGRFLGGCGLNQIDQLNKRANLGYWVRSTATRRGAATSAVNLLRTWGFQHTDLRRFEVLVAAGNIASQRVAEKAGAVREGTLRCRLLLHGVHHDAAVYSFVAAAWPRTASDRAGLGR